MLGSGPDSGGNGGVSPSWASAATTTDGSSSSWWEAALAPFGQLGHPAIRRRTLLVGGAWAGSAFVYNGVLLSPSDVNGSLYVHHVYGALVELPSYVALYLLGESLGRRLTWVMLLVLGGMPLILLGLIPPELADDAPYLPLYLMGRLGAAGASTICYVAAAEQVRTLSALPELT